MQRLGFLTVLAFQAISCQADTFFYLVRQWPTTYCTVEARCTVDPEGDAFSIHGLWPNFDNGGYPENCTNEKYDREAIADVRAELTQAWESYSEPNDEFWEHEWTCHGTCTNLDQADFFKTVLELNRKYNLEDALQSSGIVPDEQRTYPTRSIADAVKSAYGSEPTIRCANQRLQGQQLLDSVYMCFDQDLQPEDCLDACPHGCERSNCQDALYLPADKARDITSLRHELSGLHEVPLHRHPAKCRGRSHGAIALNH